MILGLLQRLGAAWVAWRKNRYDPAKHYMRGPGPKCELKRVAAATGQQVAGRV